MLLQLTRCKNHLRARRNFRNEVAIEGIHSKTLQNGIHGILGHLRRNAPKLDGVHNLVEIVLIRVSEEDGSLGVREANQVVLNLWLLADHFEALVVDKVAANALEVFDRLEAHKAAVIIASRAGNDFIASSIPSLDNAVATVEVVRVVAWEIVMGNGCGRACPACVTSDTVQDGVVLGVVLVFVFQDSEIGLIICV